MRVLICAPGYNYIGRHDVSIFALDQAKALKKSGHDVRMCYLDMRSFRRLRAWGNQKFTKDDIEIFTTNFPCGPIPKKIFHKIEMIAARSCLSFVMKDGWVPDIVHTHFLEVSHAFVDVVRERSIPIVMTEHWSMLLGKDVSQNLIDIGCNTYWKANKVLVVSVALKDSLHRNIDGNLDIGVVWNIVDMKFAECLRQQKGKDVCRFLACGTLIKTKGHDLLLKAFARINDKSSKLIIMAAGPEKSNLQNLAKQLGIVDRVEFFDAYKREQMAEELAKADCFVLASRKETFGVVYIEAMAAGVPVIATDCGGPRDFVNDKVGVLVPVDDVDALAIAMQDMVDGKVKYNSEEIAQYAKDNFFPEVIAAKLTKVYEDVL